MSFSKKLQPLLILIPLLCLSFVTTALNPYYYFFFYQQFHTAAFQNILQFLLFSTPLSDTLFSANEIAHMHDVKLLMIMFVLMAIACLFVLVRVREIALTKKQIGIAALLMLVLLSFFSFTFRAMHYLLFPQGNWQFPASSMLMQLFPEMFFLQIGIITAVKLVLLSLLFSYIAPSSKP